MKIAVLLASIHQESIYPLLSHIDVENGMCPYFLKHYARRDVL
jgi:hypothetical protein